jgi:putative transcriptional regulator
LKNNIRIYRENLKLTQEDFAKLVKVSRQTIISLESGRYIPSTILALKIAEVFKLKVEAVFSLEEND